MPCPRQCYYQAAPAPVFQRLARRRSVAADLPGAVGLLAEPEAPLLRRAAPADVRRERAAGKLYAAGAHYVVDTLADLPEVIADINARLAKGERP